MWASRFWADRFWAPRYWSKIGSNDIINPVANATVIVRARARTIIVRRDASTVVAP